MCVRVSSHGYLAPQRPCTGAHGTGQETVMLRFSRGFLALSIAILPAACSDSDSPNNSAYQAKCEQLVEVLCGKMETCTKTNPAPINKASCISDSKTGLDCSRAVAVGSTYDTCMSLCQNLQCTPSASVGIVLPPECKGVIKIAGVELSEGTGLQVLGEAQHP